MFPGIYCICWAATAAGDLDISVDRCAYAGRLRRWPTLSRNWQMQTMTLPHETIIFSPVAKKAQKEGNLRPMRPHG
jgi:hypothetical protein